MERLKLNLELRGVILILAVGVLLPVMLATAAGIVAIVLARNEGGLVTGVLVLSFATTAAGCALIAVVMTSRRARLARMQSDFAANVSHEFRTPLSVIKLYAQTLQSGKLQEDPDQVAHCVATILRETEWLDHMIDKVLTWRASSRDAMALHMRVDSISPAVLRAIERFETMVEPDALELTCSVDSRQSVRHDADATHAVVLNLLTNAHKYTGKDKRIEVRAFDEEQSVVIEVQDNGIGLSQGEARHVFDAFYRATNEDGQANSGTGLGLAITRHLVSRQGGEISVQSTKGVGSTFTVRLPVADEIA